MDVKEQTKLYSRYLELVTDFNKANDVYANEINRLNQERASSVENAIQQYLIPLIQNLRIILVIAGVTAVGSFFYASQLSTVQSGLGFGGLLFLIVSMGGAIIAGWVTLRINYFHEKIKSARASVLIEKDHV